MADRPGRVLGVDPGTKRVGLAVSDPDRLLATPHATVEGGRGAAERVLAAATELGCSAIVVGLPRSLAGRETDSTANARRMADDIRDAGRAAGVAVHLQDERLTSVQAGRALRDAGRSAKAGKAVVDQVAATLLLQAWLDARR